MSWNSINVFFNYIYISVFFFNILFILFTWSIMLWSEEVVLVIKCHFDEVQRMLLYKKLAGK